MERSKHLSLFPPVESAEKFRLSQQERVNAFNNRLRIRVFSKLTLDQANAMWSAIGAESVDEAITRSRMLEADFRDSFAAGRDRLEEIDPNYISLLSYKK